MRPLALHQMNALEIPATELVSIAHEVGCERVCVFVHAPLPDLPFEAITPSMLPEMLARMDATGVKVRNVEFFPLTDEVEIDSFQRPLELGAQLGGERLVTIIHDTVRTRAAENLARLCDLAAEHRMQVGLEFMPLTPGCTSLDSAVDFIRTVEKPNIGFDVDILHLTRSGGTPADIAELPPELFAYAQICDGPDLELRDDYWVEVFERMVPGDGVFPLTAFLDALPAATHVEVEVPSLAAPGQGIPALDRCRRAATATREFLNRAQPTR